MKKMFLIIVFMFLASMAFSVITDDVWTSEGLYWVTYYHDG